MTAAERQRRRLRAERRRAEMLAKRAENHARVLAAHEQQRKAGRDPDRWVSALPRAPLPPADELMRQLAEALVEEPIPLPTSAPRLLASSGSSRGRTYWSSSPVTMPARSRSSSSRIRLTQRVDMPVA